MFVNKHLIAAFLVTPVLAVLGYFAVDSLVSEKPHKAKQGASYLLAAKSNCRYASGHCDLVNGDFRLSLALAVRGEYMLVSVDAEYPLQGARISLSRPGKPDPVPADLSPKEGDLRRWQGMVQRGHASGKVDEKPGEKSGEYTLRLVVLAEGSYYYGETGTAFMNKKTVFGNK